MLVNTSTAAFTRGQMNTPGQPLTLGDSGGGSPQKEKPSNPFSLSIARFIQQLLQPNVFTAREILERIKSAPSEDRPELLLSLGRFIVLQEGKSGNKIILADISDYFDRQMALRDLSPDKFSDLEKYFVRYVTAEEFFPLIFLYYRSKFDVTDQNSVVKNAVIVFSDKQGECDDISMFIHYFALKKKIRGVVLGEKISDLYRYYGSTAFHAQYFYKDSEKIYVLDNNAILRFSSGEFKNYFEYLKAYNSSFLRGAAMPYEYFRNGGREELEFCRYVMNKGVEL